MKASIIKFFKRDIVQIVLIATFVVALMIGFFVTFIVILDKITTDPEMEEIYGSYEERKEIRARSMKSNED